MRDRHGGPPGRPPRDEAAKKHALRLVPYGLYLAGFRRADGTQGVNLVSWMTQTSFAPPRLVLGLHREGSAYAAVQETGKLVLNLLGEEDGETLKAFFKHVDVEDGKAGALDVIDGPATGCPMLPVLPASVELEFKGELEGGDHAACMFEVLDAHIHDADAKAMSHASAGLHYAG